MADSKERPAETLTRGDLRLKRDMMLRRSPSGSCLRQREWGRGVRRWSRRRKPAAHPTPNQPPLARSEVVRWMVLRGGGLLERVW